MASSLGFLLFYSICSSLLNLSNGIDKGAPLLVKTVHVGDSPQFFCPFTNKDELPVWIINDTYYNWNRLPDGYTMTHDKDGYTFSIEEAKLWMNNTIYSCFSAADNALQRIGMINVNFDLTGPRNFTVEIGKNAFINCSSFIIDNERISVVWIINGVYYSPTRLPLNYKSQSNGLKVYGVQETLNGSTFQCIFQSNYLWKDRYYYSDVATVTVITNDHDSASWYTCSQERTPEIRFDNQDFFFTLQTKKIGWNNATCNASFNYILVKLMNGNEVNRTNLHNQTSVNISSDELNSVEGNQYSFYVEAVETNANTTGACNISASIITFSRDVVSIPVIAENGTVCLNAGANSFLVIWPSEPGSHNDCICSPWYKILPCSCLSASKFDVYNEVFNDENKICWGNLTTEANGTIINFVLERSAELIQVPSVEREYLESYVIIIPEKPDIPYIVIKDEPTEIIICYYEVYNGHSPVSKYHVNVTDNTGNYFTFIRNNEDSSCRKVPSEKYNLIHPYCGPQHFMIRSENDVGMSLPSQQSLHHNGSLFDECRCFKENVEVSTQLVNKSLQNLELEVVCKTVYDSSSAISVEVTLKLEERRITSKPVHCSKIASFANLKPGSYYVHHAWSRNGYDWYCSIPSDSGPFKIEEANSNYKVIIVGSVLSPFPVIVLIGIVIAVILCKRRVRDRAHIHNN